MTGMASFSQRALELKAKANDTFKGGFFSRMFTNK